MDQSAVSARLIGLMFVEKGLITEEQLELALERQRETGNRLGEILVDEFDVERLDLAGALAEQWAEYEREGSAEELEQHAEKRDLVAVSDEWRGSEPTPTAAGKRPIGEIFVERGLISAAQLEDALEEQKKSGRRLGEILVATGRLTRLELASALADQWASFQKLRPPGEDAPSEARVLPMPVASLPPTPPPATPELTRLVDELAARVDEIAAGGGADDRQVDSAADGLAARVEQLEVSFAAHGPESLAEPEGLQELRSQLADVTSRIEAIPAPNAEWRSELAEVAGNLRTRIERVEHGLDGGPSSADVAEIRASVEALAVRVDSLPAPSEEWREPLVQLTARLDALPNGEWRPELERVAEKLRTRLERLEQSAEDEHGSAEVAEVRASVEALAARVDSLPTPSEEWRELVSQLAARLDALPSGEWRPELGEVAENLRTRLERVEHGVASGHSSAEVAELRAALESQLNELAARLDALPSGGWRPELAEVAENLRTRLERVEQAESGHASADVMELRGAVESLAARVDSTPFEEWRQPVAELAARLDVLPSGEWRHELAEVAENLRARLERVEHGVENGTASADVADLRASVEALAAHVESLPSPSEEWREPLAQLAENLRTRLEHLEHGRDNGVASADVADLRASLRALAARVDSLPVGSSDEWREPLAQLVARLDALPSGEWRPELSEVAENLHTRLERVERGIEIGRGSTDVAELRASLEALAARADALPAPSDAWREPLAALAQRVDALAAPSQDWREQVAALAARVDAAPDLPGEWRDEVAALAARVDAIRTDEWKSELAELASRLDAIPASVDAHDPELEELVRALGSRVEQVEQEVASFPRESLDRLRARMDELALQVGDAHGVEARLRESLAALADERAEVATESSNELRCRLDDVAGGVDRSTHRVEELAHRIDELASRRDAADVEQALAQRVAAMEEAVAGLHDGVGALQPSVEQRFAELEERAAGAAGQAAADVASLRRELDDVRNGVAAAHTAAAERVDAATAALRDQLEAAARHAAEGAVEELRSDVEANNARVEVLAGDLVSAEQRSAGRSADLSALRARLETVESALTGAAGWHDAVDLAHARVEGVELRLVESFAAEAVERDDQIESLHAEFSERADAFERERVKRKDLRELREAIEGVEQRVDERLAEDAAAAQATEEVVREGIGSIGERLSASGEAYLETGRELSRSIAGLGLALAASDALRIATPRSTDTIETSVFLAFAPTPEGYRLVECEGTAPALGGEVSIEDCEGPLVVTRVGASPLPFDRRPCVYLEPAG